ncbi:Uncharacterized protein ChrSV_4216 [Chromobacterium vaccinii]|nr:Uncharacterized protein ChrSW_4216 [Chromobacterium vaccinii]QND91673.1 Uncharacterized protein ChrSV_4216 [Chromobacterium vaccinii]
MKRQRKLAFLFSSPDFYSRRDFISPSYCRFYPMPVCPSVADILVLVLSPATDRFQVIVFPSRASE